MIVTVGGIKGGTGKSTICTNISAWLVNNKIDVILIDANPGQLTSANWVSRRIESFPTIHCVEKSGDLRKTLVDFGKRYEQVLVDVGGWDSREFRTALLVSQLVITPLRPSQADIETLPKLVELAEQASELNDSLEIVIIISQAPPHPNVKLVDETRKALSDLKGFVISETVICNRKPYVDCLAEGIGVVEMKNRQSEKAKEEINKIGDSIYHYGKIFDR